MRCFVTVTHYLGCRAELGRHVAMDTYLDCLPTLISTRSFCSLLQTNFSLWMRALALTRKPPSREPYLSSHSCYTERKAWHTVPNPSGRLVVHPKQISPCLHTYALAHASENQMKISAQTYEHSTRARGKSPLLLSQHAHIGSYPQIWSSSYSLTASLWREPTGKTILDGIEYFLE